MRVHSGLGVMAGAEHLGQVISAREDQCQDPNPGLQLPIHYLISNNNATLIFIIYMNKL